jgi:NADH:ubiquinone reductase (H+-translocating)
MQFNIPKTTQKRVVILGAGFAGLTLAQKLAKSDFQVVIIDRNNFHQFQPLFYQVAMAGLEPSSIVFPLRKIFQKQKNIHVRVAEFNSVNIENNEINTTLGALSYDYLVVALGADTNFFGNQKMMDLAIPMKTVSEALFLRNSIFEDYEKAVTSPNPEVRQKYLDIVIVGGGATGVEIAGALAEMKRHVIPKDYPDLDASEIEIHLVHGNPTLLNAMSPESQAAAERYLREMGVKLWMDKVVKDYDGQNVHIDDGSVIQSSKVIWAAGIVGNPVPGLPETSVLRGRRLKVDGFNEVENAPNVFAIGDICFQTTDKKFESGHPQVAQVAIQQGNLLAKNLRNRQNGSAQKSFIYNDLGSMATIGRHRAVVDLSFWKFQGALAWFAWLFVHLFAIIGVKNRFFVLQNWIWNYFTWDQSLRLVIKPRRKTNV